MTVQPDWPIETERLVLRPWEERDFESLHALYRNPEVVRWLYDEPHTPERTRAKLERKLRGGALTEEDDLSAVIELPDETFVGDAVLFYDSVEQKTVEVGVAIDPAQHGQGYATEALRALVDWAFSMGVHRVIARLEARNAASERLVEKLGMRREGLFVENEWVKGEWQSELVYAILEREWR